jgi:hypothetical protein
MTPAEIAAIRDLESAENAVNEAVMAREAARERLADIMSRERHRERAKEMRPMHLRLVTEARR